MYRITVRRQRADEARTTSDVVLRGEETQSLARSLHDLLRLAGEERGSGGWADADPEVWLGGLYVGSLTRDGDPAELARDTMVHLLAGSVGARARPSASMRAAAALVGEDPGDVPP